MSPMTSPSNLPKRPCFAFGDESRPSNYCRGGAVGELWITALSVIVGLTYTIRSMVRIRREATVVNELALPSGSPEWVLVREKLITMGLVGFGQIVMVLAIVLVVTFTAPRPPLVAAAIRWSLVAMPVVLALLSIHAERSYWAERDALTEKRDAQDLLDRKPLRKRKP